MDEFRYSSDSVSNPARSVRPVVPDDALPLPDLPKALFIGTGGNVTLRGADDSAPVLCANLPNGAILPIRAAQVYQTGTTASQILGLY